MTPTLMHVSCEYPPYKAGRLFWCPKSFSPGS